MEQNKLQNTAATVKPDRKSQIQKNAPQKINRSDILYKKGIKDVGSNTKLSKQQMS